MTAIELGNFRVENIVFEEPQKKQVANGSFYRIPIKYMDNGNKIELCIATNPVMTWGVQENRKQSLLNVRDGPVEYYSLPLVISDTETRNVLEQAFQACRDHLKQHTVKVALQRFNLTENMNPFYFKRDKTTGELVEGADPTLYPKLLTVFQKIRNPDVPPVISTVFIDAKDAAEEDPPQISPTTLIGCRANVIAAVTIKEIYIGANPSIQLKINDVIVIERLAAPSRRLKGVFKSLAPPSCVLDTIEPQPSESKQTPEEPQPIKINKIVRRQQPE